MKTTKSLLLTGLVAITLVGSLSSCATVFGGRVTDHQKRKPLPGEPQRAIRVGALVADILLFWPGAAIDFATGAIYRPKQPMPVQPVTTAAAKPRR